MQPGHAACLHAGWQGSQRVANGWVARLGGCANVWLFSSTPFAGMLRLCPFPMCRLCLRPPPAPPPAPPSPSPPPLCPCPCAGQPRLMESALLIFACLARYVMPILTQYMATLNGVLQVGGRLCCPVVWAVMLHGGGVAVGPVDCWGSTWVGSAAAACTWLGGQHTPSSQMRSSAFPASQPSPAPACPSPSTARLTDLAALALLLPRLPPARSNAWPTRTATCAWQR